MQKNEFDASKLAIITDEHNRKCLLYDGNILALFISMDDIISFHQSKFHKERIDFKFRENIIHILTQIDNFVKSKLKDPTKYKPLASTYLSCRTHQVKSFEGNLDHIIVKFDHSIWKFQEMIGMTPTCELTFLPAGKMVQPDNNDWLDDL